MSLVERESSAIVGTSDKVPCTDTSESDMEPFVFNESHHSVRLLAGLRHLQECNQLFDVTLIAEGQEFPAHRVVLASCSDYFHAMFTNGLKESSEHSILLTGVTASAMEQLIHFAYTSKLKITKGGYTFTLFLCLLNELIILVKLTDYLTFYSGRSFCLELCAFTVLGTGTF